MSKALSVGMSTSKKLVVTAEDVKKFADLIHDHNPIHLDPEAAKKAGFPNCICHGMFAGSLFSGLMATEMPGPNTVYLSQNTRFMAPVIVGDEIEVHIVLLKFRRDKGLMSLKTEVRKQDPVKGEVVCATGTAVCLNKSITFEGETPEWTANE